MAADNKMADENDSICQGRIFIHFVTLEFNKNIYMLDFYIRLTWIMDKDC